MIIFSRKCLMSVQCSKQAASRKGAAISNLFKKSAKYFQKVPKLVCWICMFFLLQSEKKIFVDKFFVKNQKSLVSFRFLGNFSSFRLGKVYKYVKWQLTLSGNASCTIWSWTQLRLKRQSRQIGKYLVVEFSI